MNSTKLKQALYLYIFIVIVVFVFSCFTFLDTFIAFIVIVLFTGFFYICKKREDQISFRWIKAKTTSRKFFILIISVICVFFVYFLLSFVPKNLPLSYNVISANINTSDPVIETNKNEYDIGETVKIKVKIGKEIQRINSPYFTISSMDNGELDYFNYDPECLATSMCYDHLHCDKISSTEIAGKWNQKVRWGGSLSYFNYFVKPGIYKISFFYKEIEKENLEKENLISDYPFHCGKEQKSISKTITIKDASFQSHIITDKLLFITDVFLVASSQVFKYSMILYIFIVYIIITIIYGITRHFNKMRRTKDL